MATLFNIPEGWTARLGPIYVDAKLPGQTAFTPFSIADYALKFGWRKGNGEWEEAPGEVELATEADNIEDWQSAFYYVPDDETDFVVTDPLPKQSYYARADLIDDDDKVVNAPSGASAEIVVHRK
jgi:hypothetical protein